MTFPVSLSRRAQWAARQPISDLMARALAHPELISLAAGFVDQQTLPVEATREALEFVFAARAAAQAALQYGSTLGFPPLREAILARMFASDACCHDVSLDQVLITAGSNQLLHLVSDTLLNPGDIVLCSAPTYLVYLGILHNLGARSVGVAVDQYGMLPESLEERLRELRAQGELERVKAIYLVPYFDNPCGVTMPLERRARIVEMAQRWSTSHRIHVLADEAYRELRYQGDDVPSTLAVDEEGDTVLAMGTFSKSFSPGIRIGWGILPRHLVDPICRQKGNIDFGSPHFSQPLMAEVLARGFFAAHLERIRAHYRRKLQVMLIALEQHLGGIDGVRWIEPAGGLYVWMHLPPDLLAGPQGSLFDAAVQEGMLYVPGEFFYPDEGTPAYGNTLRLSFGVQTPDKIEQGVAALARAIHRVGASGLSEIVRGTST